MSNDTKKTLFYIVGLCAFVALICAGTNWIFHLAGLHSEIVSFIGHLASIALIVCAFIAGLVWIMNVKWNKTVRIVFTVLFIVFGVLAILGVFGIGY